MWLRPSCPSENVTHMIGTFGYPKSLFLPDTASFPSPIADEALVLDEDYILLSAMWAKNAESSAFPVSMEPPPNKQYRPRSVSRQLKPARNCFGHPAMQVRDAPRIRSLPAICGPDEDSGNPAYAPPDARGPPPLPRAVRMRLLPLASRPVELLGAPSSTPRTRSLRGVLCCLNSQCRTRCRTWRQPRRRQAGIPKIHRNISQYPYILKLRRTKDNLEPGPITAQTGCFEPGKFSPILHFDVLGSRIPSKRSAPRNPIPTYINHGKERWGAKYVSTTTESISTRRLRRVCCRCRLPTPFRKPSTPS